ncbi:MAG TPA: NUDIX domain-containing protein, partial [Planctomycetota bacterium]|nr:NUDIX domain-containing protein [Planctomycetota bacterium]
GEAVIAAAQRRLREEMGISSPLTRVGTVSYSIDVGGGLCEHEFNHVFCGAFEGEPQPDPGEVSAWQWMAPETLRRSLRDAPKSFTPWFDVVLDQLQQWLQREPPPIPPDAAGAWRAG